MEHIEARQAHLALSGARVHRARSGAWPSTSTPARAAARAWSPARPRTTSRSSARSRCRATARCTGCASTATTPVRSTTPTRSSSRCRASSARTRPCEVVCPVAATVHSEEGLNDMVYNRCVGTRYCSNNCPWKVRRFNFLLYQDWNTATLQAAAQSRRHRAQPRRDGEVHLLRAAHQRARASRRSAKIARFATARSSPPARRSCPTDAIVFGNINDPNSRVAQLKASPRNYATLEELNTRPRTTYLAAVRNPNPSLPTHVSVGGPRRRRPHTERERAALMANHVHMHGRFDGGPRRPGHRGRATTSRRSPRPSRRSRCPSARRSAGSSASSSASRC